MSAQTIRILIIGALLVHGVGHTLGFWKPVRSWLLSSLPESTRRIVSSSFWFLSAAGFVAACIAYLGLGLPSDWWRPIAVTTSFISLSGLIIFFGNWPFFNTIGAFGMNLLILITLLPGL